MGLGREAEPVRSPEHRDSSGFQQPRGFDQHGFGVRDMLDDVAAVDRSERIVRKGHRLAFATNEPDLVQAGFVESFACQQQPAHCDVHSEDFARHFAFRECDQGTAGPAAQVEDRRTGGFGSTDGGNRRRPGAFENVPHLATHVRRAQFQAMPLVISAEKLLERYLSGMFLQIGGDCVVAGVTAVRVIHTPKIGNSGEATVTRATHANDTDRVPLRPIEIGPAGGAANPRLHFARFARAMAAGPSSSQALTTRPTAARLSAEHLSAVSSTVCQWG